MAKLKERLKDTPKDKRSVSYAIWPYSPEEYKGKRFGTLPNEFLRWIVAKFGDSENDRKSFLASQARAEIELRQDKVAKLYGSRADKGALAKTPPMTSARVARRKPAAPTEQLKEQPPTAKKHGIEL